MSMLHTESAVYAGGQLTAFVAIVGAFADILPRVAAGLAVLWYLVLLWDRWNKRKNKDFDG